MKREAYRYRPILTIDYQSRNPAPWEKQEGETAKQYRMFSVFRDMPPPTRTIKNAAKVLGVSEQAVYHHAKRCEWTKRAEAWDLECARRARETDYVSVRDSIERHLQAARLLQDKAIVRLQRIDPDSLDALAVLKYLVEAIRIERQALGIPDTQTEHSYQELRQIEIIYENVTRNHQNAAIASGTS